MLEEGKMCSHSKRQRFTFFTRRADSMDTDGLFNCVLPREMLTLIGQWMVSALEADLYTPHHVFDQNEHLLRNYNRLHQVINFTSRDFRKLITANMTPNDREILGPDGEVKFALANGWNHTRTHRPPSWWHFRGGPFTITSPPPAGIPGPLRTWAGKRQWSLTKLTVRSFLPLVLGWYTVVNAKDTEFKGYFIPDNYDSFGAFVGARNSLIFVDFLQANHQRRKFALAVNDDIVVRMTPFIKMAREIGILLIMYDYPGVVVVD